MPNSLPMSILCIACKDTLSAHSLHQFSKGRTGLIDTKQCFTMAEIENVLARKQPIILALDENFTGFNCPISDIKNLKEKINPVATLLHCNDGTPERYSDLLDLNFDAYTLKTEPCDLVRQAITFVLKRIKYIDYAIIEKTKHLSADTIQYHGIEFKKLEYKIVLLKKEGVKPSAIPARLGKTKHIYNDNRDSARLKVRNAGYEDIDDFLRVVQEKERY